MFTGRHVMTVVLLCMAALPLAAQEYTLRGTVVGTGNGTRPVPVAGATIEIAQASKVRTVSDASGKFTLPRIRQGRYTVIATAPGYAPVTVQADLNADQTVFITMASTQAKSFDVSGTILERGSTVAPRPLEGATITLMPGSHTIQSDKGGRFLMKAVPAGPYTLAVTGPKHKQTTARFTLSANQALNITLAIDEAPVPTMHSLSGVVTRRVGSVAIPIAGATVVTSPGGYAVDSDSTGRFSIPALPPDDYTLSVRAAGQKPLQQRVSVPADGDITLVLTEE
jgi:hypothetical protein